MVLKRTLHIEGAGVDSPWLPGGVSSIVPGVLVTRCGGVHLHRHAKRVLKFVKVTCANTVLVAMQEDRRKYEETIFFFSSKNNLIRISPARPLDGRRESSG